LANIPSTYLPIELTSRAPATLLPPLEEPNVLTSLTSRTDLLLLSTMCPAAHHIVCSELILASAAEAVAAASILVGLSYASASAAAATAPTTTTMPTATAIDSTAAVANA
jgi:hypothetical protein